MILDKTNQTLSDVNTSLIIRKDILNDAFRSDKKLTENLSGNESFNFSSNK